MGFDRLDKQGQDLDFGAYVSGEKPEMTDFYPELAYYRDIVFLFKLVMTPEVESLPDVRSWRQSHAKLHWSYKAGPSNTKDQSQTPNTKHPTPITNTNHQSPGATHLHIA
jgi:hypothetical protein